MPARWQTGRVTSSERSQQLFDRAREVVPGGVNSPVRAFRAVGGTPRFMASAEGPYLTDADGNDSIAIRPMSYFCMSWDHRALDGALAAQFLKALKDNLETL